MHPQFLPLDSVPTALGNPTEHATGYLGGWDMHSS